MSAPRAWFALGLKHGPASSGDHVLGWPLRRTAPDHVLLGAESRFGMPAELLVKLDRDGVLFSTMIEHRNPFMRAVWAPIVSPHQRIVRRLLERAASRLAGSRRRSATIGRVSESAAIREPLRDAHGRTITDLRVSVTDRCNFRCRYCMPAEGMPWLAREEVLSFEEIERLVRILTGLGIEDVRLTGGEPLVRREFPTLVSMLRSIEASATSR